MELTRQAFAGLAKTSESLRHRGCRSWLRAASVSAHMHPTIPACLMGSVSGGDESWMVTVWDVTLVDGTITEAVLTVPRSKMHDLETGAP